jgi:hypothetical protein
MRSGILCTLALVLWLIGAAAIGWLFLKGWTTTGSDGRTEILLSPSERDLVLTQMRQFLEAIQAVLADLGTSEASRKFQAAETAARKVGMGMDKDVNPTLVAKIPLAFKQMGMSVHHEFDRLADGIAQGETAPQIIRRLSTITSQCTACHEMYRFSPQQ